jgi:hypothetical protein
MSCQSHLSRFCNLDAICRTPHFIKKCYERSTVVSIIYVFRAMSIIFKLQKLYLHLIVPGQWWGKYSLLPMEKYSQGLERVPSLYLC